MTQIMLMFFFRCSLFAFSSWVPMLLANTATASKCHHERRHPHIVDWNRLFKYLSRIDLPNWWLSVNYGRVFWLRFSFHCVQEYFARRRLPKLDFAFSNGIRCRLSDFHLILFSSIEREREREHVRANSVYAHSKWTRFRWFQGKRASRIISH